MGPWQIFGVLANGGTVMLYEGAPDYPDPTRLWQLVERHRVTILGVSPTLVRSLMMHDEQPSASHDLTSLRILGSSGEPWNEGRGIGSSSVLARRVAPSSTSPVEPR